MHPLNYIIMAFGGILAVVGIAVFVKMGVQGTSSVRMFGFKFELGGSALVIFVVGVVVFLIPVLKPVQRTERPASPSQAGPETPPAGETKPVLPAQSEPVSANADIDIKGRDLQWCNSLGDNNFNDCSGCSIDSGYPCRKIQGTDMVTWSRKNGGGDIGIEIPHQLKTGITRGIRATFEFKVIAGRAMVGIDKYGNGLVASSDWKNAGFDEQISITSTEVGVKGRWGAIVRLDAKSQVEMKTIKLELL